MDLAQIIQTILIAAILVLMVVGVTILNGIAKSLKIWSEKSLEDIEKTAKVIVDEIECLRPTIAVIGAKKDQIERVLNELPDTVKNIKEISENIMPAAKLIGEKTPELQRSFESLSDATGKLRLQAEEFGEKVKPTVSTISGIAKAFFEGIRVFKAFKK